MDRRKFLISSLASSALMAAAPALSAFSETAPASDMLSPALQQKLAHDPLRPQFHLLPRHNWMNDPCAPRYYKGEYHMFFQYNPDAATWGDMHWNHATSPDLVHWKHMPLAIAPTPGSFDSFGIFTGSVLPGMEQATVLYTGVTKSTPERETIRGGGLREVQCLATSTDPDLRSWNKLDKPVIDGPPEGLKVTGFRDPCPWKDGDTWYLLIGSGFTGKGGAVLLYSSKDGRNWSYLHPLAQGPWSGPVPGKTDPVDTGEMWECPDFFPLGDKHVLLYSTERKVYWNVGVLDRKEMKFHTEKQGLLDHGFYYAMKSMEDAQGRRVLWGWVEEHRSDEALRAAGWAGCMALPRVLTLAPGNELRMDVPAEFASLRRNTQVLPPPGAPADMTPTADQIQHAMATMRIEDRAGEVVCVFKPGDGTSTLELQPNEGGAPLVSMVYNGDIAAPALTIAEKKLKLTPDKAGFSTIHVWLDGSVIEILVDNREAITLRDYSPAGGDIQISLSGDAASLRSLSVSGIKPISSDRLTT